MSYDWNVFHELVKYMILRGMSVYNGEDPFVSDKVDITEVTEFLNDLQEASAEMQSQLDNVKESIETINSMSSFSGKAAKEAKNYFEELHGTILESFKGLFDDLEENLKQHIQTFESNVDSSDSAVIQHNYLKEVQEEINDVFEDLEKQDEIIHHTIQEVADIASATPPPFSDVNEWKGKADKKIKELNEDLDAFTGEGDETDVKAIMEEIEAAMGNAKASEGKARFADFEGASQMKELAKLQDYNEDKQEERQGEIEKARNIKDKTIKDLDADSQTYLQEAYTQLKNEDISKDQYDDIVAALKDIQRGKEPNKSISETVKDFIKENSEVVIENAEEIGAISGNSMLKQYIEKGFTQPGENLRENGKKAKMMGGLNPEEGVPNAPMKEGKKLLKAGEAVGQGFMVWDVAYGVYDNVHNEDMTSGEAMTHNAGTVGAAITGDAVGTGFVTGGAALLGSNPGGWAVAAGIAGATVTTWGFKKLYDNNVMHIQDGLDWAGEKVDDFTDKAGEAIHSTVDAINPFS